MGLRRALAALLVLALGAAASEGFSEVAKLVASDGAAADQFGTSISTHGDLTVVGAFLDDPPRPARPRAQCGSAPFCPAKSPPPQVPPISSPAPSRRRAAAALPRK